MSTDPFLDGLAVAKARARGPRRTPWEGILIATGAFVLAVTFIVLGLIFAR